MRLDQQDVALVTGPAAERYGAIEIQLVGAGARVVRVDHEAHADEDFDAAVIALTPSPTAVEHQRMYWPELAFASRAIARLSPRLFLRAGTVLIISPALRPSTDQPSLAECFADTRRIWLSGLSARWAGDGIRIDHLSLPRGFGDSTRQRQSAFEAVLSLLSDRATERAGVDVRFDGGAIHREPFVDLRGNAPNIGVVAPTLPE